MTQLELKLMAEILRQENLIRQKDIIILSQNTMINQMSKEIDDLKDKVCHCHKDKKLKYNKK